VLIKKAAKIDKGSGKPHLQKVGKVTRAQLEEIAKTKIKDLTAADLDGGEDHRRLRPLDGHHGGRGLTWQSSPRRQKALQARSSRPSCTRWTTR
jgi:hypothetical protein